LPNVDIRLAKDKDIEFDVNVPVTTATNKKNNFKELELDGAVKELCKYSTKESDIIQLDEDDNGIMKINWADTKVIMKEIYIAMNHKRTLVLTGAFKKTKDRLYGKKEADDLVEEMSEADLIQVFKKRCKECGSAIEEHLYAYYPIAKNYKEYKNQNAIDNYKKNQFERINIKLLRALEQRKNEDVTEEWVPVDDGYDPFTMDIGYDEYLKQKKSDVSSQRTSDE
ncbi:hypothetical protein ACV3X0_15195, partial [Clostridium perfringens]